jgi:hypothetical protein
MTPKQTQSTQPKQHFLIALALTFALFAAESTARDLKCGARTLHACTQDRVAHLAELGRALTDASHPPANASQADLQYARWAATQKVSVANLHQAGQKAAAGDGSVRPNTSSPSALEAQTNFNNDYLQLLLQMNRDRQAHARETLSNLMKKLSDTANTIISNIK